jgi:DNA-binding transcriptional MocR family regulator
MLFPTPTVIGNSPRYARLAEEFAARIAAGTLSPGERLPSVRVLARQRALSVTTVLAALRLLEARGLVEARPQSGYYVRAGLAAPAEPEANLSLAPRTARLPAVSQLIMKVLAAGGDAQHAPIGSALPSPALFPAERLKRIVAGVARRHPASLTTYFESPGLPALRREIARRMGLRGVALREDDIVVTNGCIEAVNLALRAVTVPGDVVAIESPAFFSALQIIESLGLKALEIPTHPRDGVSIEALDLATRGRQVKACLFTPCVSNPLGSLMPAPRRAALAALARERGFVIVEDDIYAELAHGEAAPLPVKHWDEAGQVILCSSFNKTLAPGLRVGWIVPGRWRERVEMLRHLSSVATPALLQWTIAEFLASGGYDRQLRAARRAFALQVGQMAAAVAEHFPSGTRATRPAGGFVLWVALPQSIDTMILWEHAAAEGITFAPGALFTTGGDYRHCLRLNCGYPFTPAIGAAVRRLGTLAGELLRETAPVPARETGAGASPARGARPARGSVTGGRIAPRKRAAPA